MKSWSGRREKAENSYSGGLESHQESGPNTFVLFTRLFNMPLRNNVFMPWSERSFLERIIKFLVLQNPSFFFLTVSKQ